MPVGKISLLKLTLLILGQAGRLPSRQSTRQGAQRRPEAGHLQVRGGPPDPGVRQGAVRPVQDADRGGGQDQEEAAEEGAAGEGKGRSSKVVSSS